MLIKAWTHVIPVLCAEGQPSHQDVCDEAHGRNVEIGRVHIKAWSHRSVLLVAHLPVLQHTHEHTLRIHLILERMQHLTGKVNPECFICDF